MILTGPKTNRALTKPRPPRVIGEVEIPDVESLKTAIRALRTGEKSTYRQTRLRQVASEALGQLPRTTANETMDTLNKFIVDEKTLSIGYADNNGGVTHRIIDPIRHYRRCLDRTRSCNGRGPILQNSTHHRRGTAIDLPHVGSP